MNILNRLQNITVLHTVIFRQTHFGAFSAGGSYHLGLHSLVVVVTRDGRLNVLGRYLAGNGFISG